MREDAGRGWRHVVPSPRPLRILNIETIAHMLDSAAVVIAAGGGGIPVVRGRDGQWRGIEAVIDKDFASALLAVGAARRPLHRPHRRRESRDRLRQTDAATVDRLTVAEAEKLPRRRPVPRRLDGAEDRSRDPVRARAAASRC